MIFLLMHTLIVFSRNYFIMSLITFYRGLYGSTERELVPLSRSRSSEIQVAHQRSSVDCKTVEHLPMQITTRVNIAFIRDFFLVLDMDDALTINDSRRYDSSYVSTCTIRGVPIVSLITDGKERLCLAQISNDLLKDFSYNEIHNRRVGTYGA